VILMANGDWGIEIPGGWFDSKRHMYRNVKGTIVPSTTQVFSHLALVDLDGIPQDLLEWKRDYGIACHKAVEFMAVGDLDWDSLDEAIIPAVTGIEAFLKKLEYQHEAAEEIRIGNLFGMEFGLTSDLRGSVMHQGKRRKAIIDLKSAVKRSETWSWQIGSYTSQQEKTEGGWMGIICQFDKAGNVTPHYVDVPKAQREFQTLLAACILGINAGLYKPKK
jgi:hypothetical protein